MSTADRASSEPSERHTFLGREDELELLGDRLGRAAGGHGALVVLRGAAGSGTTATARQAAGRAGVQDIDVLWGAAQEGLAGRPFAPLAQALETRAASARAAALYGELGDGAPALARLAPALRGVLPAIPPPAPLEAPDEVLRLVDGVLGWLERSAEQRPVLLVIDDLQWADEDTVALLAHVALHVERLPLLLLATWADYRLSIIGEGPAGGAPMDEPGPDGGGTPVRAAGALLGMAEVVELAGLDEGATGALLGTIADRPVPPAAVQLVQTLTGGHPLAALELYRHLREEDLLGRAGREAEPRGTGLPQTVEEIIAWRLARLSLETRSALAALACFFEPAPAHMVAAVSGLSRTRTIDALEQAVGQGLAQPAIDRRGYEIVHERIRRSVIAGLPAAVRRESIGRAAEILESELAAEARQRSARLAALNAAALNGAPTGNRSTSEEDPARSRAAAGIRHALVAAEQARAASAFARAADCLAAALELAEATGQPTTARDLRQRLLVANAEAGRREATIAAARSVLAEGGQRAAAEAAIHAVWALAAHGHDEAAEQVRLEVVRRVGAPDALTSARLELLAGQWQEARAGGVAGLFWIAGDETAEQGVLRDGDETDVAELFAPHRPRSHEQTVRLLNLARGWRRPAALLRALHGATVDLATRLGLFREATSWASQYVAAAERYGSPRDLARAWLLLAQCRALSGEFDAADEAVAAADELLARLQPLVVQSDERLVAALALAHYRDGDWSALAQTIEQRIAAPSRAGLLLHAEHAFASARSGNADAAARELDDVLKLASGWAPLTYLRDSALLVALTVAWEMGWAQYAVQGRTLATHAAAAGAGGSHAATPELAIARMRALQGQLDEARPLFAAQREWLEAAGLRPLRAIVDHDEAIAVAATGQSGHGEATALLEGAVAAFDELGMAGWAARDRLLLEAGFANASQPGGRLHFTYPAGLSRREADLVRLMAGGAMFDDAARQLELDAVAAERHLASAMEKLGAAAENELPRLARRHGLGGGV